MREDWLEGIAAVALTHGYIIEILLSTHLRQFPAGEVRDAYAQAMVENGRRTDGLGAASLGVEDAVQFGDIVEKSHAQLADIVARAMKRAAAGDTAWEAML